MITGFVLGVGAVVLLVAGAYFFWYRKLYAEDKAGNLFTEQLFQAQSLEPEELEVRISNIESKVEAIYITVNHLGRQLDLLAKGNKEDAGINPKYIEIYKAYDKGMGITEIARQTGRNKGEIELILNLRKLGRVEELV